MAVPLYLMSRTPLTFNRTGAGYWDESGRWVEGGITPIATTGSLQPFKDGNKQTILPEGRRADEAYLYFTKTKINTANQFDDTNPDTVEIDGREYYALAVEDWSRHGLASDHYKVTLLRKDQPSNGGL